MTEPAGQQPGQQPDQQPDEPAQPTEAWSTGDERVDDAVARLDQLDELDLDDHTEVYASIHDDLSTVLGEGGPAPQGR
jgi:hypothetical protein